MKSSIIKQNATQVYSRRISNKTITSSKGMSLIEIVVALALLAVIMFFMSSSQLSALKMNHKTGIIRELTHTAEREMEIQRQQPLAADIIESSTTSDCQIEAEKYNCTTAIHPCHIVTVSGEDTIACIDTSQAGFPEAEAVSHQIVIDIIGPTDRKESEQRTIRLQTIVEAKK